MRTVVHVELRWGGTVVRAQRIRLKRAFAIGDGGDWEVPCGALGANRFELLRAGARGSVLLAVPPPATAWTTAGREHAFRPSPVYALEPGARAHVEMGAFAIDVEVARADDGALPRFAPSAESIAHQAASALLHAGAFAVIATWAPRLASDEMDAEQARDRIAFMVRTLNASAARELDAAPPPESDDDDPPPGRAGDAKLSGGTGTRARAEEGAPGSGVASRRNAHVALQGAHAEPDPHLARAAALREAATFGVIGLAPMATGDPNAPASPWALGAAQGRDATSARAPLWGASIDEAFSWGGLGLTGTGEGGGGRADAIGLGSIGTFGRGAGIGTGDAFGAGGLGIGGTGEGAGGYGGGIGIGGIGTLGHGSGLGQGMGCGCGRDGVRHRTVRVSICGWTQEEIARGAECGASVNGRLPPEAIRRVVQANSGRFRLCYERALRPQPSLSGRVVTRFVIARDGSVSAAVDGGSSLADPEAVACVVRTFSGLSFPEPAGGTVSVEYPIAFAPE